MDSDSLRNGTESASCITLRAVPYGEADMILTLFSEQDGRIDARAYGARSMKSPYRAACQPFCASEMEFYVKGGRRSVKAAHVRNEFFGIQKVYRRYAAGCTMLELADRALQYIPPEDIKELFHLLAVCLRTLDSSDHPAHVLLFYLIRMLHQLGVFPALRQCAGCGRELSAQARWSRQEGGLVCAGCAERPESGAEPLDAQVWSCLRTFGRGQICSETDMSYGENDVVAAAGLLREFLEYQLGLRLRTVRTRRAARHRLGT